MRAHLDALGALDQLVDPGTDRQPSSMSDTPVASTISGLISTTSESRALGNVDHDDLLVHVDLGRGEADARRGVHGLGHVGDELLQARRRKR